MKKKTAILLGATGLTGSYLLDLLLDSEDYEKVLVFTRRTTGKLHPKLQEIICDLLTLEKQTELFRGDTVFCCIGTTKSKTPDKDAYKTIDYGIPVSAAKLSAQNGIQTFVVVSALGADEKSNIFYSRTKGEMEQEVLQSAIRTILIYRPSLIYGERKDNRWTENIGVGLMKIIKPLLVGKLKKYSAIYAKDLAKALYKGAENKKGHHVVYRSEM